VSPENIYFVLGTTANDPLPTTSPTNQTKTIMNLNDGSTNSELLTYTNGAQELGKNPVEYNEYGDAKEGHFSVYRTTWKNNVGYILRNNEQGNLNKFYKTEGTLGQPFMNLTKLVDMPFLNNKDGRIVPLSEGIYFFSNTGSVSAYKDTTGTWEVGAQSNVNTETLLAASDGDRRAYLITDDKLIKFNEVDLTFTVIGSRPNGEQWLVGVF
jgi:hypothetical protein